MNWLKSQIILVITLLLSIPSVQAQSALYIQGDKQTPIYVKVEGKMMPRQGFHYCLIPGLEAGTAHFEVLFQGNKYPVQKYIITIPQDGIRGLILTKVDDQNFALFDLQTQGYIYNNNKSDEAFLQLNPATESFVSVSDTRQSREDKRYSAAKNTDYPSENQNTPDPDASVVNEQPEITEDLQSNNRFMDNIDLSENKRREKKKKNDKSILVEEKLFKSGDDGLVKDNNKNPDNSKESIENPETVIPNTDCSAPMSEGAFESFLGAFNAQPDDETKLKYVKRTFQKRCFSSEQAGILANLTNGQSSRFELLQTIYPRVSDQSNYGNLEKLFSTAFLKKRFRELIK